MAKKVEEPRQIKRGSGVSTVSSKGQVTIPKDVRDALGLKPMDRVTFEAQDGQAVVRRVRSFLELGGSVEPRNRPEDWKKVREEVRRIIAAEIAAEGR